MTKRIGDVSRRRRFSDPARRAWYARHRACASAAASALTSHRPVVRGPRVRFPQKGTHELPISQMPYLNWVRIEFLTRSHAMPTQSVKMLTSELKAVRRALAATRRRLRET